MDKKKFLAIEHLSKLILQQMNLQVVLSYIALAGKKQKKYKTKASATQIAKKTLENFTIVMLSSLV